MKDLITGIIHGAPVWVWPLLLLLVLTGLRATRERKVPVYIIYAMPLLGILSLNSTAALAAPMLAWPGFALAYAIGAWFGWQVQSRWLLGRDGDLVTVAGEWLTLLTMMVIYWLGFTRGVVEAINQDLWTSGGFVIVCAVLSGLASGSFLGRAIRTMRA